MENTAQIDIMNETKLTPPNKTNKSFEPILGIDLGTTYSLAAIVENGQVELIENAELTTFQPSIVSFTPTGVKVGKEALAGLQDHTERSFYSFKRFMGQGFNPDDPWVKHLPYRVSQGERKNVVLGPEGETHTPEELSSYVLRHIKETSEKILARPIKKAIITVPAYFDDAQRQATRDAANIAGLEVVRIINEPTAAAIAYGLENKENALILVFDLGGGTFDLTLLKIQEKIFRVLATYGDTQLGGDDFDQVIAEELLKKSQLFSQQNPKDRQTLKIEAEKLKIALSSSLEAEVKLMKGGQQETLKLSRQEFEAASKPWLNKIEQCLEQVLKDGNKTIAEVQAIVLVGGSSRLPMVRELVQRYFDKVPYLRLDPDKVVAYGAAIQADLLKNGRRDFLLMDVIPLSLGLETIGGVFEKLILRNSSLPARAKETFSTSVDNQTAVEINIYQGEREFVKDCRSLGKFRLQGLPAMPAGFLRIEVDFLVDSNGILEVKALELRSNKQATIDIIPEHGLSRKELEKMIEDSITYARKDFEERSLADLKEKAKRILQGIERSKQKMVQLISPAEQQEIFALQALVEKHLANLQEENYDALKQALDSLGEKTRDLADQLISLAAKEELTASFNKKTPS